jgi:hypothetical protein
VQTESGHADVLFDADWQAVERALGPLLLGEVGIELPGLSQGFVRKKLRYAVRLRDVSVRRTESMPMQKYQFLSQGRAPEEGGRDVGC